MTWEGVVQFVASYLERNLPQMEHASYRHEWIDKQEGNKVLQIWGKYKEREFHLDLWLHPDIVTDISDPMMYVQIKLEDVCRKMKHLPERYAYAEEIEMKAKAKKEAAT